MKSKALGLILAGIGLVSISGGAGGLDYSLNNLDGIRNRTLYKQFLDTKRELNQMENTPLIKLLAQDKNLPRELPELVNYYTQLQQTKETLENSPEVIKAESDERRNKFYQSISIADILAGLGLSSFGGYFIGRKKELFHLEY